MGNFGDLYAYHYPLRHMAASALQEGRLPLWNPYIFCGTPFAANTQAALFMPTACVFYILDTLAAFDFSTLLYLVLAFLGAQLLARRWGLNPAGAFTLAAAFALHPFVAYRVAQGIPTHLAGLAFVPWVWLGVEAQGPEGQARRSAGMPHSGPNTSGLPLGPLAFLSLILSLQALSGHPQFMVINLAGVVLYLALRRPGALLPLFLALCATAALTAVQWVPTIQYAALSVRSQWNPMYASAYSMPPSYWAAFVWPRALGTPLDPSFKGFPSEFFEMGGLYGGLVPLALAAWGVHSGRKRLALLSLLAAGACLALGAFNPVLRPLFEHPGLGSLRVPARWILLSLWALWMAACAGWKRLAIHGVRRSLVHGALAALVVIDLAAWDAPFLYPEDPAHYLVASPVVAKLRASGQRYATAPDVPNPNKGMLYRLPNVTGYEAFYLAGAARYASTAQREASADGSHTYILRPEAFKGVALRWYLDGKDVTEVKDAQPLVYHAGSQSPDPDAPAFTQPTAERWEIPSAQPPVVVAQAFYPGWRAWSGDVEIPIEEHEGFLQRVAGSGPVHLRFDPFLWNAARWLSVIALVASLSWIHRYFIPRAS